MENLGQEIQKLLMENLRKTVPSEMKKATKDAFLDTSTRPMGFTKITKPGYTP
jgi:hypothetical protein